MERKVSNITREAVIAAIAEYDRVGRDQFLAQYGIGPARTYWLRYEGRKYDSKALAGAAFGHLPGNPTPLSRKELHGGKVETAPVLRALGFEVDQLVVNGDIEAAPGRNPSWTRDELILALELYHRHGGADPGPTHPDVIALSEILRAMAVEQGLATFRNPQGVAMKLMNFRSLDPAFVSKGGAGLKKIGKLDRVVWEEFAGRPLELSLAAEYVRTGLATSDDEADPLPMEEPEYVGREGRLRYRKHLSRERDRRLVVLRKQAAMRQHGKLACEVCDFDFAAAYGPRGLGYVEAHHVNAVREMEEETETRAEDLALLCANCHRIVHRQQPWLSLPALKNLLRGTGGSVEPTAVPPVPLKGA